MELMRRKIKMGKNKPRRNPDKKQNNYGSDHQCSYFDGYLSDGKTAICEAGVRGAKCEGNRHNCVEQKYRLLASVEPERRPFV
jgi:hypothetical protein